MAMSPVKRHIIFLFLVWLTATMQAQDITGTWEGSLGEDQFLQLNIIQNGNKLCGYTWDYVRRDRSSFCKAYFEGYYYKKQGEWIINGLSFMENSGMHYLMRVKMTSRIVDGRVVLEGLSTIRGALITLFGLLSPPDSVRL